MAAAYRRAGPETAWQFLAHRPPQREPNPSPVEALKRYDAERRPIMNDVVMRNRHLGPEAALPPAGNPVGLAHRTLPQPCAELSPTTVATVAKRPSKPLILLCGGPGRT